jgi:hypothetical protein
MKNKEHSINSLLFIISSVFLFVAVLCIAIEFLVFDGYVNSSGYVSPYSDDVRVYSKFYYYESAFIYIAIVSISLYLITQIIRFVKSIVSKS